MKKLTTRKPRTGMSRPVVQSCNFRVDAFFKARIEKGAEQSGTDIVCYIRAAVEEKLDRDRIQLSAADYAKVAAWIAKNEERQRAKLERRDGQMELA